MILKYCTIYIPTTIEFDISYCEMHVMKEISIMNSKRETWRDIKAEILKQKTFREGRLSQ